MTSELNQWLIQELEQRGWSIRELARRAELSHGTINSVLAGKSKPGIDFCLGTAKALHIDPVHVFRIAGILPQEPEETVSMREVVFLFNHLDDETKEEAIDYLRYLRERRSRKSAQAPQPAPAKAQA